jgi:hypothetical protein
MHGSEVIRVREQAPPVRGGEQLVARPGVSDHLPVRVERIPLHGREDGVLAELASVDMDRLPYPSVGRKALGGDGRSEVIHTASRSGMWIASPLRTARNGQRQRLVTPSTSPSV